jgi:hypothetical protein
VLLQRGDFVHGVRTMVEDCEDLEGVYVVSNNEQKDTKKELFAKIRDKLAGKVEFSYSFTEGLHDRHLECVKLTI